MCQLVNFDYFLVKNDYSLLTLNYLIGHLQLTIRKSQFDLSLVAKILMFQSVNFDQFFVKNVYLNSEKITR